MSQAFAGKLLKVDLTTGKIVPQPLDEEKVLKYLGARGYNARLLWELVPPGINPLGPENVLIFGTGTLTGTSAPTSGRTTVSCKGPATGLYLKTSVGGTGVPSSNSPVTTTWSLRAGRRNPFTCSSGTGK